MYYSGIPVYYTGPMYTEGANCTLGYQPWAAVVGLTLRSGAGRSSARSKFYWSHRLRVAGGLSSKPPQSHHHIATFIEWQSVFITQAVLTRRCKVRNK